MGCEKEVRVRCEWGASEGRVGALEHARAGNEAVGTRVGALRDRPVRLDAAVDLGG